MKQSILFLTILFYVSGARAQEYERFPILERKSNSNKIIMSEVLLEDLEEDGAFDGKYFKIVKQKSNTAIRFDDVDTALTLKAATVYHHLTKARRFWMEKFGLPRLEKHIVRLEITNLFDEQGLFAHDNRAPQYNNALSIPSGESPDWIPNNKKRKWGNEIWFRPMKKIELKDLTGIGPNPLTVSLNALEQPFINLTVNQFNTSMVEHLFYPTYAPNPLWVDVVRFAGTIALTKLIIEGSKHTDRLFVEKYYYMDTAMVPEVIYHEYAHIMLSDYLELSHSTPVIEGYADYFATILANRKKVYAPAKGYSNATAKNSQSKKKYNHWYESNTSATADFVLSVLWDVRLTLGEAVADKLIFNARSLLSTKTATINQQLIQAILDSCNTSCSAPKRDKLLLYKTFSQKGF